MPLKAQEWFSDCFTLKGRESDADLMTLCFSSHYGLLHKESQNSGVVLFMNGISENVTFLAMEPPLWEPLH